MQYSYFIGILSNLELASIMSWVYLAIIFTVLSSVVSGVIEYNLDNPSRRLLIVSGLSIATLLLFGVVGFGVFIIGHLVVMSVIADYSKNH